MTTESVGLAMTAVACLASVCAWAWPRLRANRRGRSVVHAGRRVTGFADPERGRPPQDDPAQVLAGRWGLERVIGRGGMGRVWVGTDRKTGRRVAVKMMEVVEPNVRKILRDIFLAEARALSRLRHPNIVDFIEAVPDGDGVALVFELVTGKTVQQMLVEDKRLDWEATRALFVSVARALSAAHAGNLVHRDLKPANIMVDNDGVVKVMDFGVARTLTPDPHAPIEGPAHKDEERPIAAARTSTLVGTPAYMPPEALQGLVTARGDLFSAGVCIYEALAGRLPYGVDGWSPSTDRMRRPMREITPGISPQVDLLLDDLLQPDLERRLKDARALEQRLLVI